MKRAILVLLAIILLGANFIDVDINKSEAYDGREMYEPALAQLNSIQKLADHIDKEATDKGIKQGSVEYAVIAETVIKKRFYYGFSHYNLKENWIAAVGERLLSAGLASIVDPEDILKHPSAGCLQQSIVMIEVLREKGFDYRTVSFPHHFAVEFGIGRKWYFFDPNLEPSIPVNNRLQSSWDSNPLNILAYYDHERIPDIDWKLGVANVKYGRSNASVATNAHLFQNITWWFSKIMWMLPLCMLLYPIRRSLKQRMVKILFYTPQENPDLMTIDLR